MPLRRFTSILFIILVGSFLYCNQLYAAFTTSATASLKVNGAGGFVSLPYGSAVHLTWTTTKTSSCTLSSLDDWVKPVAVNGSFTLASQREATTFTLSCVSGSATVISKVDVAVEPEDTGLAITLTANQDEGTTTIDYNATSTLEWTSDNSIFCSQVYTGTTSDFGKLLAGKTYGTKDLKPLTKTQTFYINCESPKGKIAAASVTIQVNDQPIPTATLTADEKEESTAIPRGATTTLAWESTDTNSCVLFSTGTGSSTKPIEFQPGVVVAPQGQTIRTVKASTVYTISCGNSSGVATSSVEVDMDPTEDLPVADQMPVSSKVIPPKAKADTCSLFTMPIRYGSRDKDTENGVSALQKFLNSRGLYKGQPTGFAGKGTIHSIQLFQKGQGILPTGFAGLQTLAKMKNLSCNR